MPAFYPWSISAVMRKGCEHVLRMLLPPICLLCGAKAGTERDLCAGCAADLPLNSSACQLCATPLGNAATTICAACLALPPLYDRAFAPFRYQAPLDYSICQLKFAGRLPHARLLGALFADAICASNVPLPDCLIPIPLHPRRLRERGFNQSLELARPVAQRLRLPLHAQALERVRYTVPQAQLHARARHSNLRGAFILKRPLHGQCVALFDDVMTTTSTVRECATVLRAGAVREIQVWVIARAGAAEMPAYAYPTVSVASGA